MKKRNNNLSFFFAMILLLTTILTPVAAPLASANEGAPGEQAKKRVLMMTATYGFHHDSIETAEVVLPQMAEKYGFEVEVTKDVTKLNAEYLKDFDVLFFANTTGELPLTDQQKEDIMDFIRAGKGFVGAHAATDTLYTWKEYGELTGGYFRDHPWTKTVTFKIEDKTHPSTSFLGDEWTALEEVYRFQENPRWKGKHILMSLQSEGGTEDNPNAWCSPFQGGRMWYTALGHHPQTWLKDDFQQHLLGGLEYAWGDHPNTECDQSFQKEVITNEIPRPVGLRVAEDGTIYTISIEGFLYAVSQQGEVKQLLSIPTTTDSEHGLMGIALDPDFGENGYMYLYYTQPGTFVNKLSRFTLENGAVSLSSELVLLEVKSDNVCCHQAGNVDFGPDGKLYLSTGDNNPATQGPQMNSVNTSQNLKDLRGKILRINKDGSIPEDNPFFGREDARNEIYAYGFRNPYRFHFDDKTGWIYVGDVGPDHGSTDYDEMNLIKKGGDNYGWPYCIGDRAYPGNEDICATTVKPLFFYPYTPTPLWGTGGRTAMAGPVYYHEGPGAFPDRYQGKLFAFEFSRGWIKEVEVDQDGNLADVKDFLSGFGLPIAMTKGPDGALYMSEFGNSWWDINDKAKITKIYYGKSEHPPIAKAKASVTEGAAPLTVKFTNESMDPDNDPLTFEWDFGDGNTSTDRDPTHTYTANGAYTVTMTVTDITGKSAVWTIVISVGNSTPVATIESPLQAQFVNFGGSISIPVKGSAFDAEDGDLACSQLKWSARLIQNGNVVPLNANATGCETQLNLGNTNGLSNNDSLVWEIELAATDSGGTNGALPLTGKSVVQLKHKRIQAEDYSMMDGIQTETTSDIGGGKNVGYVEAGDWIAFKDIRLDNIEKIYYRAASNTAGVHAEFRLDSVNGPKIGEVKGGATGEWQNWKTLESTITPTTGLHDLYIYFPLTGQNVNWIQFAMPGDARPTEKDYDGQTPEPPKAEVEVVGALDRSAWKLSASHSATEDPPAKAIDGVLEKSRWSTGVPYTPEMWFLVDLGKPIEIDRLHMVSGGDNVCCVDTPKGFDVQVSVDNVNFTTVVSQKYSTTPPITADLKFEPVVARYVRISPTESDDTAWWTIAELNIFEKNPLAGFKFTSGNRGTENDSSNPSDYKHLYDGYVKTRWDSGGYQKPGMWLKVDMNEVKTINQVIMNSTGHKADYPRGYVIEVSTDDQTYTEVAKKQTNTDVVVDAKFNAVQARYVKITQTGTSDENWWSINQLIINDVKKPATAVIAQGTKAADGKYVSDVTLKLEAGDTNSALAKTEYSLDGGQTWTAYSEPIVFAHKTQQVSVLYRSTDAAGNVEDARTFSFEMASLEPSKLKEVAISSSEPVVRRTETIQLSVQGTMNTGEQADLSGAQIVYSSSRPDLVTIDAAGNLTLNRLDRNIDSIEVWATVTLEDVTVQSDKLVIGIGDLTREQTLSISFDQSIIDIGEEAAVSVDVNAQDLYAFNINFTYDPQLFELQDVELNDAFGSASDVYFNWEDNNGRVGMIGTRLGTLEGLNGELSLVTFKLKAKDQDGLAPFVILHGSTFSDVNTALHKVAEDIRKDIAIANADLNGDGYYEINDIVEVAKAFMKKAGEEGYDPRYDMNKDGIIDITDISYVALKIFKQ